MLERRSNWILVAVILAVAGCGGGGGGGGGGNQALGAITVLSDLPGLADIREVRVEFADNGDGVAVWASNGGFGDRLVYSSYSATSGTWSAEGVLADSSSLVFTRAEFVLAGGPADIAVLFSLGSRVYAATHAAGVFGAPQMLDDTGEQGLNIGQLRLVPNGSGYAAVWAHQESYDSVTGVSTYSVRASVRPAATDTWGPASTLSPAGEELRIDTASDGTGYMAVWALDGDLFANYYSAGAWLINAVQVETRAETVRSIGVASNGSGYQLAWNQGDGTSVSTWTTSFDPTFVKSANVAIDTSTDETSEVAIIGNGTDYLVTWLQSFPMDIVASRGSGIGWSFPLVLDEPTLPGSVSQTFRVATNGGGYAVMWFQDDAGGFPSVWSRVYSGGWSPPEPLDTTNGFTSPQWSALASNGNGYAAVWVQNDDGLVDSSSLWANVHNGLNWQGTEVLEGGSDSLSRPSLANRGADYAAAWAQQTADDSAMLANIREFSVGTGAWSAAANVAPAPRGGSVYPRSILGNAAGLTLASWAQRQGRTDVSYVAVQAVDGIWGPSVAASADSIATNGAGFGIAWSGLNATTGQFQAFAQIHDGRTWGTPMVLGGLLTGSAGGVSIASDGTGYAAVWAQEPTPGANPNIYGSFFNGIGWSAPVQLDGAGYSQSPSVASNGTGYAASWDGLDDSIVPVNVFDGANWGGQTTVATLTNQAFPEVRSNGTGYLIYWQEDDAGISGQSLFASVSPAGTAGDFAAAQKISTGADPVSFAQVATNGTGYGLTWLEGDEFITGFVHASLWDGTWSAATRVGTGANPELEPLIAGSNSGFGVAWKQQDTADFRPQTLKAAVYSGGAWGAPMALETADDPVDTLAEFHGGIASNGTTYAVSWSQQVDAAIGDGRYHAFASVFNGATWDTRQIENRAAETASTLIETAGGKYSVMWAQPDPAGDAGVTQAIMFTGLE